MQIISTILLLLWSIPAFAQVTLPKGIFWLSNPDQDSGLSTAMSLSYVDGASMRYHWAFLEPGDGSYSWTQLDADMAAIKAKGKHVQLLVSVGQQSPCWVKNAGASVYADYATFNSNCTAHPSETFQTADALAKTVVPLPWNSIYLSKLNIFIQALAAHLSSKGELATVSGVVASGIALGTTETRLPNPTDTTGWIAVGYSRANIKNAYRTIFTDWAHAFPNAGISTRFLYDSFPQGFGACHTPDNLFPRELIDIAYSISPSQAIIGNNGLNNSSTINAGSGPGNAMPQMCDIQRGPSNLWQDCEQTKENCENGTDVNTFQGSSFTPHVALEGLQEDNAETNTFAAEWNFAERGYTQLQFIEVYPAGFTAANQSALMAAHTALTQ